MWYLFGIVQALEVLEPALRNLVAGPVTIEWADIPPLLCDTELLGAIAQPKGGTPDLILACRWVYITLTLKDIRKYLIYFRLVWIDLHL